MKIPHLIRAVVALALLPVAAAGCTSAAAAGCPVDPVPTGLAIAVGGRANSPRPSWPTALDPALSAAIAAARKDPATGVTLVRVDGEPTVACVRKFDASAKNGPADEQNQAAFKAAVRSAVRDLQAAKSESDPLGALSRAAAAAGPGGTVALIDSGLQTVPPLDFTQGNLLDRDITWVVDQLTHAQALPDLSGRKVILAGIGYTAAPQKQLGESRRAHLIELWQRLVTAAGATDVLVVTTPNTADADEGVPAVRTVPVPALDVFGCNTETILPDDGAVGFQPGSTAFRDERAARTALGRYATWLAGNPQAEAQVTGSIAHYGSDDPDGLARDRARTVAAVLTGGGATRVTAKGDGWGPFPSRTAEPDDLSDRRNRRVVIRFLCQD